MNVLNNNEMGGSGVTDMGSQTSSQVNNALNMPLDSLRPGLEDSDFGGVQSNSNQNNAMMNSLLRRQNFLGERQMVAILGARGGESGDMSRSPLPKKSFLERERVMDAEMRKHMKEALAGFQRQRSGALPVLGSGTGNKRVLDRRPMTTPFEGGTMGQDGAVMAENIQRVELP